MDIQHPGPGGFLERLGDLHSGALDIDLVLFHVCRVR
jgi:hypothetical protein